MFRAILAVAGAATLLSAAQAYAQEQPPRPQEVYLDFAADGRIDGSYPPDVLDDILSDATLNQYGDPLVMLRLRRAVRQQLAGDASTSEASGTGSRAATGPPATTIRSPDPSGQEEPDAAASTVRRPSPPTGPAEPEASGGGAAPRAGAAARDQPLVAARADPLIDVTTLLGVLVSLTAAGLIIVFVRRRAVRARA